MICKINKPDTIQFSVKMERDDDLYTACMWARITFDNKNWSMMAQSDAGDYSYSWCVESGGRKFLELMQEIDSDYLLGKISDMSRFDAEATKENVIDMIVNDEDLTIAERDNLIEEIRGMENHSNDRDFLEELENIHGMNEYSDLWECIESDYPARAKTFAKVFTEIIQPEIRRYLKEN